MWNGNYTIELNKKGIRMIGVDPSEKMLGTASKRNSSVVWKIGNAENIPLEKESIFGTIATLTIHHWDNLDKSFKELNRVLLPSGKMVIFTSTPEQMAGYWLNYYFPTIMEKSMQQMPTFKRVEKKLLKNGFEIVKTEKYFVQENLQDLFLYSGKHQPTFYLNEKIRQGISSFSSLANKEEVDAGLTKLKKDLFNGEINHIISDYENEEGDYLFIVAKKI
ncbi:MAG: class I SAM-dependent methyltransferase [Saprospiraceae bacterium]